MTGLSPDQPGPGRLANVLLRAGVAAAKYPNAKTICHSIDFSSASNEDYAKLGLALDPLPVGVLSKSQVCEWVGLAGRGERAKS